MELHGLQIYFDLLIQQDIWHMIGLLCVITLTKASTRGVISLLIDKVKIVRIQGLPSKKTYV
jgi:hypothetical protein